MDRLDRFGELGRWARLSFLMFLSVVLVSSVGCGSSKHDAQVQAQRRQQFHEQQYRAKQTQEKNALKDYNSGS